MLRYVGLLTRRGKAFHPVWVFALLLGASVTAAAAETLPTLTISNPHTSGLLEGETTRFPIESSENLTSSLPVTVQFTRTGDFISPYVKAPQDFQNCMSGDGTGNAACPYEVDLFDYKPSWGSSHIWNINLRTDDDDMDEPDGTLTVVIEYGDDLTTNSVTVDIRDDDPTVVSLARVGAGVLGAGEALTFRVSLGRALV
ncbi:MAG: hypothetical protein F4Z73_10565, partial [Synechococcus sp. SB0668_bin_13]|nr:hypothetical protein [Synechococcus sp. SB0668_bin_13]